MVVGYELVDVLPHQISFNAAQLYNLKHNHLKMTPLEYPPRFVTIYRFAQEIYTYLGVKANADVISEIIQKWWNKYAYTKIEKIYTYKELEDFTNAFKKDKSLRNSFYGSQVFDPTKVFILKTNET